MTSQYHISLDPETARKLETRALACDGNASKAMRSFILESGDPARRLRDKLWDDIGQMKRALGMLRAADRMPGNGKHIDNLDGLLRNIEQTIARVTTE